MKRRTLHRNLTVWMLLIAFMAVHVVKTFHSHEAECGSCPVAESGEHHSAEDCLICHFTFSPFEVYVPAAPAVFRVLISTEQLIYREKEYSSTLFSYQLRAPPAAASFC